MVLLRPASATLQVYVLRRHVGMAFAGGMFAFPGGKVDTDDYDASLPWAGPSPEQWSTALRTSAEAARALVCAAVRETFEESGVLLAGPTPDSIVPATTGDWEDDRRAIVARELAFSAFLRQRKLMIRSDLLRQWAHWITPESEPRRYDTRFFVAALPRGQVARDVSGEADQVTWLRPADALAAVERGEMAMLPPTYRTLRELSHYDEVAEVLACAPDRLAAPVLPESGTLDGSQGTPSVPDSRSS